MADQKDRKHLTFFSLETIWKDKLYPLTKDPAVETMLREKIRDEVASYVEDKQMNWHNFFRFESLDDKQFLGILNDKPWTLFPLPSFVPVEDPYLQKKTHYGFWPNTCNYQKQCERYQWHLSLIERANKVGPEHIQWWTYIHECHWLNGKFLMKLLQMAFPEKEFYVVSTPAHTWVQDELENNYDLFWPQIEIDNLDDALYDLSGKEYPLHYE